MPLYERVSADIPVTLKTTSYTIVPDDNCIEIQFESASSVAAFLPSVSDVSNGFNVIIRNVGAGTLTIDPSGSETIDGNATESLSTGTWRWIRNDGTTWKSISTSAASSGTMNGNVFTNFRFVMRNNGGTLQHFIGNGADYNSPSDYAAAINGATITFQNTPTGTDSSTAMVGGAKVGSVNPALLLLDTADLTGIGSTLAGITTVRYNTTGTPLIAECSVESRNINGITQPRMEFTMYNATSGIEFNVNTTNIASGKSVQIIFQGYLPVYS